MLIAYTLVLLEPRSTCISYAGVLGLLDYDAVEVNNLHRQILHSEERVGTAKTESAKKSIARFVHHSLHGISIVHVLLHSLNSSVTCHTHHLLLTSENAMEIIKQ